MSNLKQFLFTSINVVLYALSGGRLLWLEGRFRRGTWLNWLGSVAFRPAEYARPGNEAEIVEAVQTADQVRCVGAGHSFNAAVVSEQLLLSLDDYTGIVWEDLDRKQVCFRGGTRVRDINRILARMGLAIAALPSHDAQSIAGVLSTDVHGTGKEIGFVSQSVVAIKLLNGLGDVIECRPEEDLFRAAVGGIGAVGVIIEATLQCVDAFHVEQRTEVKPLAWVEENLDSILADNQHASLFLFPFSRKCQLNTWNRTERRLSRFGNLREAALLSVDALLLSSLGPLLVVSRTLPRLATATLSIRKGTDLVLESHKAFNRSVYHYHEELEFAIPYERAFETWRVFENLYRSLYPAVPYNFFELRFTPAGHDRSLLSPGRGRRSCYLELLPNRSRGYERYFAAAGEILRGLDARPHLGKHNPSFNRADMERLHGEHFERFRALMKQHDPHRKFANAHLKRLFY